MSVRWLEGGFGPVTYTSRTFPAGPIIHYVFGVYNERRFSVIVSVRFGAAHIVLQSGANQTLQLVPGTPHLVEHVLHELHILSPPFKWMRNIVGDLNARVDRERMLWWVREQPVGHRPPYSQPAQIAKGLVETCTFGIVGQPDCESLLTKANAIVDAEKGYRQDRRRMDWRIARMIDRQLLSDSLLGVDPIGESDRLATVGQTEVLASWSAIAGSIISITLLGGKPDISIMDSVEDAVRTILGNGHVGWRPASIPRLEYRDIAFAEIASDGSELARVTVAIALASIREIGDEGVRARRAVLSLLLNRNAFWPITSEIGDSVHIFALDAPVDVPWAMRERADVWLLYLLEKRLAEEWADELPARIQTAGRDLGSPGGMAKLIQVAESCNLTVPVMLDAVTHITKEDVVALIDDLREPLRTAQIYYGPTLSTSGSST